MRLRFPFDSSERSTRKSRVLASGPGQSAAIGEGRTTRAQLRPSGLARGICLNDKWLIQASGSQERMRT
jgi:hypothetical protein